LPTPKAFLSPQKPSAAIKAEQREREKGRAAELQRERQASSAKGVNGHQNGTSRTDGQAIKEDADEGLGGPSRHSGDDQQVVQPSQSTGTSLFTAEYEGRYPPEHPPRPSVEFPSVRSMPRQVASLENLVPSSETGTSLSTTLNARSPRYISDKGRDSSANIHDHHDGDSAARNSSNDNDRQGLPTHYTRRTASRSRSGDAVRRRRYETFENPLTTFFCGGRLVTGGDDYVSFGLAATLLFGMTGVWIGTTGVWMWQYGSEYGLARGGGVAVVICFV
jgi:palmitoyltransferase ZDHHC9/14/18